MMGGRRKSLMARLCSSGMLNCFRGSSFLITFNVILSANKKVNRA